MTDISAELSRPKIPVWRTAYDGYRLGIGAIFSSGAMFRYFMYGSLAIIAAMGALFYISFTTQNWVSNAAGGLERTLALGAMILAAYLAYAALAAMQTPLGVIFQRHMLLGEPPRHPYFAYLATGYGRRFFNASAAIYGFFFVASLIHLPFVLLFYGTDPFDQVAVSTLFATTPSALLAFIAVYVLSLLCASLLAARSSLAFPIAAADSPGPALRQSFVESRGAMWRLFFVFALIYAPAFVVYFIAIMIVTVTFAFQHPGLVQAGADPFGAMYPGLFTSPAFIIGAIIALIAFTVSQVAMVAGAARAYQIRVERGLSGIADVFS